MRLHLFGRLADHRGRLVELAVPGEGVSLDELRRLVKADDRMLGEALDGPGITAWIGREPVPANGWLPADATVEFWPPVSGG